jgi:hypothetical protein
MEYTKNPQKNAKKTWIPSWIKSNQDALAGVIASDPKDQNVVYLDDLISKIIAKEEGKPGYSILKLATARR